MLRGLSSPLTCFPLLLYTLFWIVYNFVDVHDLLHSPKPYVFALSYVERIHDYFIQFWFPYWIDHLIHIEIPGWLDSIGCFIGLRLLEYYTAFNYQVYFTSMSVDVPRRSEKYLKHFQGSIEAYPVCYCVLSAYMLNMWFAHLFGACGLLAYNTRSRVDSWYLALDDVKVPYEYLSHRIKKPPDGFITATVVLCLIIFVNMLMFLHGLYIIYVLVQASRSSGSMEDHDLSTVKVQDSSSMDDPSLSPTSTFRARIAHRLSGLRQFCLYILGRDYETREENPYCLANLQLPGSLLKAFSSNNPLESTSFDSDGLTVVLDNSATCHICNDKRLFTSDITPLSDVDNIGVDTAGGTARPIGFGNIRLSWTDDNGTYHEEVIEDVLYFPKSPVNIIGITKLGIQRNDPEGTHILTKSHYSVFTWNHGKHTRTIHHHASGLPELPINQGTSLYKSFCSAFYSILPSCRSTRMCLKSEDSPMQKSDLDFSFLAKSCSDGTIIAGDSVIVTESGSTKQGTILDVTYDEHMLPSYNVKLTGGDTVQVFGDAIKRHHEPDIGVIPQTKDQLAIDATHLSSEDLECVLCPEILTSDEEEFMHWHHRLHHLPAKHMLRLAKADILPKKFLKLKRIPKCASCAFGQAHRRSWRTKGQAGGSIRSNSEVKPGDGVSTDQLVSAQPGLVPQMSGSLTAARITGATVFVDHVTQYVYVHLMKDLTQDATIEAKAACERLFASFGHKIRHYRADNGRYADKEFMDDIHRCNQRISFCGVGAHHQNAIAERGIKELTLIARTLLLHAIRHWPEYVTTILWPFALKTASDRLNRLSVNDDLKSPLSLLSGASDNIIASDLHTWGCPVYVLDADLQYGSVGPPKWDPRSRLGIYVGRSPIHAGSVALVLNPKTGHVSPQYHVVFDDDFTTVPFLRNGHEPSHWEQLCQKSSEKVTTEAYDLAKTWVTTPMQPPHSQDDVSDSEGVTLDSTSSRPNHGERGRDLSSVSSANEDSPNIGQRGSNQMPPIINLEQSGLRRSTRTSTSPKRFGFFSKFCLLSSAALSMHRSLNPGSFVTRVMHQIEKVNLNLTLMVPLMLFIPLHLLPPYQTMKCTLSRKCYNNRMPLILFQQWSKKLQLMKKMNIGKLCHALR